MAFTKTTWNNGAAPGISAEQLNRIENGINDLHNGSITPDQSQTPVSPGSGTMFQIFNWTANRIKAITGRANWYDAPSTTLENANTHINAAAPHSGHETPAGAQAKVGTHANEHIRHTTYAAATGGANAYAVTLSPAPTAYADGMCVVVKINVDNTGASTINVNGLGAKTIKKANGNDVSANNLKAESIYTFRYNGTNFILQGSDSSGNATPADLLVGKTASTDAGEIVGTMPNRGAVIITPSTTNQTILNGYHDGSGYVKGDSNLVAGNIKEGINIFGVTGSLPDGTGKTPYLITSATIPSGSLPQSVTIPNVNFTPSKIFVRFYGDISLAGWGVSADFPLFTNVNEFYARVIAPGFGSWLSYIYVTYSKNGSNVTLTVEYRGDLPTITSRGSSQIYIYGN